MTRRFMLLFTTVLFALGFSQEARAQLFDGKMAVRTNGNNRFRKVTQEPSCGAATL